MRLIDADVLKERILKERDAIPITTTERYGFGVEVPYKYGEAMRGGIRKALRCMEQTPTIEAEPVKHGRWETVPYREFDGFETVVNGTAERCTNCCRASKDFKKWFDYCPNCGAKMDGGNVE